MMGRVRRRWPLRAPVMAIVLVSCASPAPTPSHSGRTFAFERDTFAFVNNTRWAYEFIQRPDGTEEMRHTESGLDHTGRCTMMSRAARQFYYAARFDGDAPVVNEAEYRKRVRAVLDTDPRRKTPVAEPITIPGFASLREMSEQREDLLKELVGDTPSGYRQRGNWRMIFGFPPEHQRRMARRLLERLAAGQHPLVHVSNFPQIDINHTVLVIDVVETPVELRFAVYDPNDARAPVPLVYDRASARFSYARTLFFPGGHANVYEVYDGFMF